LEAEKTRGEFEVEKNKSKEVAENQALLIPLIPVV
jgi:hypothetical protein